MVKLHAPITPRAIVVKRPRRSAQLTRTPTCLWPGCGARLAHDHSSPVCAYHVPPDYNPRHDPKLRETVRHLVLAAYPNAVDLCDVLRCTTHDVEAAVRYLNRRAEALGGMIVGARRGFVWEPGPIVDRLRRRRA